MQAYLYPLANLDSLKKEDFRDLYDEAYEFALPQRNLYDGYYDGKVGGAKKMNRVFDAYDRRAVIQD